MQTPDYIVSFYRGLEGVADRVRVDEQCVDPARGTCGGCNGKLGEHHHFWCDLEPCPFCGEPLATCGEWMLLMEYEEMRDQIDAKLRTLDVDVEARRDALAKMLDRMFATEESAADG